MENISLSKYLKLIVKKWRILLYFVLGFTVVAILYGVFLYSPTYTSNAKILIKRDNPTTYVTELNSENTINSYVGQNNNPILTQIEIIKSEDIINEVVNKLSKDEELGKYNKKSMISAIKRSLKLTNQPGTDIISVEVKWNTPEDAQKIAMQLLNTYSEYNESLHKKSIYNTKTYIEKQLHDINKQLADVREEIEKYRTKNSSVNIDLEAQSIITQIEKAKDLAYQNELNISSTGQKVNELSENIGVNVKKAVDSVALGQSQTMLSLNQKLNDNQQKLASLKIKYPETTPQIKILVSEINEIKKQIENQTISLIGQNKIDKNKSLIEDNVRSELVSDYVRNTVDFNTYKAQKVTLQKILNELTTKQKSIPEMQKTLQDLQDKERNLALIAETLNTKLVEAQIKESAIVSNINIAESPIMPSSESFPTFVHLFIIFIFIGVLMGIAAIIGLYYVEDICEGTEDLEEILRAPVLGSIPWLTNISYVNLLTDYNPHSIAAIIYQKIAISLKVKCYNKKYNSIAIISSEMEKRRSLVAASLANTFAKTEDRVFLVDTDFRDSSLTREFNIDFSNYPDITDCIMELSKSNGKVYVDEKAYYNEIVGKYIIQVPGFENLFLIPNNNKVDNPYEILNNDAFPKLMQILKASFDLVILDTPPMLAVADSIITSQHVDGLVVLCGVKACRSNLRKIRKICDDNYVEILGAIARDTITELDVPENMYIKQLSGNIN